MFFIHKIMNVNCVTVFIFVKSSTLSRLMVVRILLLVYNMHDLHGCCLDYVYVL